MAIKNYASNLTHRIGCCSARPPSRRAGMNMSWWLMSWKNKRGFRWQKKKSERRAAIVLRAHIRRAWGDVRAITIKAASIFGHHTSCSRNAGAEREKRTCIKLRSGEKKTLTPFIPSFPRPLSYPYFRPGQTPFLFSCRGIVPAMASRLIYWAVNYANAHFLVSWARFK